ncbi:MAG: GTP-binding protein [Angelakisella sp.]
MTEFYLITGFLGAGKTTFLKNFIRGFAGRSLRLIINEFGNEGVDGMLLAEVSATLREISGGSIFCSCRLDRFEEALEEGLATMPDLLIVEASGLSDPTNIRRILEQNEQQGRLCYRGCICLVDAARLHKVLSTARVVKKQLAAADLLLINKADAATPEQLEEVRQLLTEYCPQTPSFTTTWGAVQPEWLCLINPARRPDDVVGERPDITNQRAEVFVLPEMTRYELERFISSFAEDTSRIKGFVRLQEAG